MQGLCCCHLLLPYPLHALAPRSVYVRVRPLNDAERTSGTAWRVEGNGVFQVRLRPGWSMLVRRC